MAITKAQREAAIQDLRTVLKPGDTVYTILKSVSSSGMSRHISVLTPAVDSSGRPYIRNITILAGRAIGMRVSEKTDALVVGGAGMDMGFHVVYSLSRALYSDGTFCTGKGCNSNDHSNDYGDLSRQYADLHPEEHDDNSQAGRTAYCTARAEWMDTKEPELWSPERHHSDGGYTLSHRWL